MIVKVNVSLFGVQATSRPYPSPYGESRWRAHEGHHFLHFRSVSRVCLECAHDLDIPYRTQTLHVVVSATRHLDPPRT